MSATELYRFDSTDADTRNPYRLRATRRAPGNVPYVVDNLWEWRRPPHLPSRRRCVCASPRPEIAQRAGGASDGRLFRVILPPGARVAQIPQWDARSHPDVRGERSLAKLLLRLLGQEWVDASAAVKASASLLWTPCLTREEVEETFAAPPLASIKRCVWEAVRFWDAVKVVPATGPFPYRSGEVFFEAESWELIPHQDSGTASNPAPEPLG